MANAPREDNRIPGLVAKSDADNSVVVVEADPDTKRLKVDSNLSSISGTTVSEYFEDDTHTSGDGGVMALVVRNDTIGALTNADGDYASLQINASGALYTEISTALPTGSNAIGKLASNSGVDIGDVTLNAGTAAFGKLSANDGVDIGDVDVITQPARDRLTDNVGAGLQTDVIMNDTTALTPMFASIQAETNGNNTLVSAVSGKIIRVLSMEFVSDASLLVRLEDGASGTAVTGIMDFAANSGMVLPFNPVGHFQTQANVLLNMELTGTGTVAGSLVYVEV